MKCLNLWSYKLFIRLFLIIIGIASYSTLSAQYIIELTVIDGGATTTCTDGLFNSTVDNPMWGVAVQDEPVVFYENDDCNSFVPPPANRVHYSTAVNCLGDLNDGSLFVCLWSFDNDPAGLFGNPCNVSIDGQNKGCLEVPCGSFPLPPPGSDRTYTFTPSDPLDTLTSTGFIEFKISVSEDASGQSLFNDAICNATPIPLSMSGGTITDVYSNDCATSIGDEGIDAGFTINNSVWFEFVPSETRSVDVFVNSNPTSGNPIEPEVAVFYARGGQCSGSLERVMPKQAPFVDASSYFLNFECLNPKETYYILVDGTDADPTGSFSVSVAELDYPDPVLETAIICPGNVLTVGNNTYANPGTYIDTLISSDNCIEIKHTTLRVTPKPLSVSLETPVPARGEGEGNGVMLAKAEGAAGSYSFIWSDGSTDPVANNLIGGVEYCVTVTDNTANCEVIECLVMDFPIPITANASDDVLDCANDQTGQVNLEVNTGKPPYQYRLQGIEDPSLIESGVIIKNDSIHVVNNLPIGTYNIAISNNETVQNVVAMITAPTPIDIAVIDLVNVSCFGECSGSIDLAVSGGEGNYTFAWDKGLDPIPNPKKICAGTYSLTVTDGNNCKDSSQFVITEPIATILNFSEVQAVTCFGEDDGQATVSSFELLNNISWDNGETTPTASNLKAGFQTVRLTTSNNCIIVDSVEIPQPDALVANIEIIETIACGGENNGVLADASTGGNGNFEYTWSNASTAPLIDNLSVGTYTLLVTDGLGCEDDTLVTLDAPVPLDATIIPTDVNCPEGTNSGSLTFMNPTGGMAPYLYSIENTSPIDNPVIANLNAGTYTATLQDDNGCKKTFPNIIINNPPEVSVDIGPDLEIKLGATVDLVANTPNTVSYDWSASDTVAVSCLNCPNLSSQPFTNITYFVKVTDIVTGCTAEDEMNVFVLKEKSLFVPTAFSPNGDGINDQLNVFGGPDVTKILRFEIYARNGSLIFKQDNFLLSERIGWDGRYNQQLLPTDVFIYFAEVQFIDGGTEIIKGDFTLIH